MRNKILWILTLSPMVVTLALLPFINDEIPAHFDFNGDVTRYGPKYELLIVPTIIILWGLVWRWLIKYHTEKLNNTNDEKLKKECQQSIKVTHISAIVCIVTFILIQVWFLAVSL